MPIEAVVGEGPVTGRFGDDRMRAWLGIIDGEPGQHAWPESAIGVRKRVGEEVKEATLVGEM